MGWGWTANCVVYAFAGTDGPGVEEVAVEGVPAEAGCALGEVRPVVSVPEAGVVLWEGPAADGGGPNVMVSGMAVREQVQFF